MVGKKGDFTKVSVVLDKYQADDTDKYISREFQKYGYDLAQELGDDGHVSLYIKLAKEEKRGHLETAKSFVRDASNVKSKPALFMWKLSQLKKDSKDPKDTK